jgi:hypothetical protein
MFFKSSGKALKEGICPPENHQATADQHQEGLSTSEVVLQNTRKQKIQTPKDNNDTKIMGN